MSGSVLILGGYGNFGKRIARALVSHNIPIVIAGRSREKADALAATLNPALTRIAIFDARLDMVAQLEKLRPAVVINTCGPFQESDYSIAQACIARGVHYIDLADARDYACGISALDAEATQQNVAVISGASTVPGLSSAVIEHYRNEFSQIYSLTYGISPGHQSERGVATAQAILTYVGKKLRPFAGAHGAYGWQGLYRQDYPGLGKRWMANCDIPDLNLLPAHYAIGSIRFSAGLELGFMHLGLWALSWLVRLGMPLDLPRHAPALLAISNRFNALGSGDGGMHMIMRGTDKNGAAQTRRWFIIAKNGDGPHIPCVPATLLAKRLATGAPFKAGAYPCVGLLSLQDYLDELKPFAITTIAD